MAFSRRSHPHLCSSTNVTIIRRICAYMPIRFEEVTVELRSTNLRTSELEESSRYESVMIKSRDTQLHNQ